MSTYKEKVMGVMDNMIHLRMGSTRVPENMHEDIHHNADMRYYINILNEALSRIKDISEDTRWISIEDEKPEHLNRVLVLEGIWVEIVHYDNITGFITELLPTHWMPLPQPPTSDNQ